MSLFSRFLARLRAPAPIPEGLVPPAPPVAPAPSPEQLLDYQRSFSDGLTRGPGATVKDRTRVVFLASWGPGPEPQLIPGGRMPPEGRVHAALCGSVDEAQAVAAAGALVLWGPGSLVITARVVRLVVQDGNGLQFVTGRWLSQRHGCWEAL